MEENLQSQQETTAPFVVTQSNYQKQPLGKCVFEALEKYFTHLDGHMPDDLYSMVISEIEKPLFQFMLEQTNGNQSQASKMLGISRSTLRKKLASYNLDK
ncbi:MAG: Fis family transcriptional regulator [Methylococcales bacterium]|jgi:Fis family transcriptional regulator|nr:Fis family transcriptional regulator [Methylococcales bacterium]